MATKIVFPMGHFFWDTLYNGYNTLLRLVLLHCCVQCCVLYGSCTLETQYFQKYKQKYAQELFSCLGLHDTSLAVRTYTLKKLISIRHIWDYRYSIHTLSISYLNFWICFSCKICVRKGFKINTGVIFICTLRWYVI